MKSHLPRGFSAGGLLPSAKLSGTTAAAPAAPPFQPSIGASQTMPSDIWPPTGAFFTSMSSPPLFTWLRPQYYRNKRNRNIRSFEECRHRDALIVCHHTFAPTIATTIRSPALIGCAFVTYIGQLKRSWLGSTFPSEDWRQQPIPCFDNRLGHSWDFGRPIYLGLWSRYEHRWRCRQKRAFN